MPHVAGFCKSLSVLILLLFLFVGCSSVQKVTPLPQDTGISSVVNESARNLEKSKNLIETGMLDSLVAARKILSSGNLRNTEQGKELDYIAYSFMTLVYPYYNQHQTSAIPLKSSIFPVLTAAVKSGHVPDISEKNTTFFTLMFSAAAVFYSTASDVLDRCHDIAVQLDSFSKNNLYAKLVEAKIFEIRKDSKKSFSLYAEIAAHDSDCYPAQMGIARIYIQRKDYSSAIKILELLHGKYPGGKDISSLLVESYLDKGDREKANTLLEDVLVRDPGDVDLALQRARLLLLSGQIEQAGKLVAIFESEKGETRKSITLRVLLLMQEGFLQKAEILLKKGLSTYPEALSLQVAYGKLLLKTGQFGLAESYLKKKIKTSKNDPDLLRLLVLSYIKERKWEKASPLIAILLRLDSSKDILRYAVEIYYNEGETEKALEYNKKLVFGMHPDMEDYFYRVVLLVRKNKRKEALDECKQWFSTAEKPEKRSLFYYYMSLCVDNPVQKKEYLQKALFENLQNLQALFALSSLYEKQGEYRKAYRYLKQASIIDPEDRKIKDLLRKLEKNLK